MQTRTERPPEPAGSCLTSLDPSETISEAFGDRELGSPKSLRLQSRAQHRIHERVWPERAAVLAALETHGTPDDTPRITRISGCCMVPGIHVGPDGDTRLRLGWCRDRLCPTCQQRRSRNLAARLAAHVASMDSPRFATFTVKHRLAPLREQLDALAAAFRRLRTDRRWNARVSGGFWVLECKPSRCGTHWHPHLHCVIDGAYFPQKELADAWSAAVGELSIVDIRKPHSSSSVASYLAKYVAKTENLQSWPPGFIVEFGHAMHRRRLVNTFGNQHGLCIDQPDKPEPLGVTNAVHSTVLLADYAQAGLAAAREVVVLAGKLGGLWAAAFGTRGTRQTPLTDDEHRETLAALMRHAEAAEKQARRTPAIVQRKRAVRRREWTNPFAFMRTDDAQPRAGPTPLGSERTAQSVLP